MLTHEDADEQQLEYAVDVLPPAAVDLEFDSF